MLLVYDDWETENRQIRRESPCLTRCTGLASQARCTCDHQAGSLWIHSCNCTVHSSVLLAPPVCPCGQFWNEQDLCICIKFGVSLVGCIGFLQRRFLWHSCSVRSTAVDRLSRMLHCRWAALLVNGVVNLVLPLAFTLQSQTLQFRKVLHHALPPRDLMVCFSLVDNNVLGCDGGLISATNGLSDTNNVHCCDDVSFIAYLDQYCYRAHILGCFRRRPHKRLKAGIKHLQSRSRWSLLSVYVTLVTENHDIALQGSKGLVLCELTVETYFATQTSELFSLHLHSSFCRSRKGAFYCANERQAGSPYSGAKPIVQIQLGSNDD